VLLRRRRELAWPGGRSHEVARAGAETDLSGVEVMPLSRSVWQRSKRNDHSNGMPPRADRFQHLELAIGKGMPVRLQEAATLVECP